MKRTFRFYIAFILGRCANRMLKLLGKNASYFPGKVAITVCPDFLGMIPKPKIIIGVTGTNGKTTVANLISDCLENCGYTILNNRAGSNINAGIASSLLKGVTLTQKVKHDIAVFEIDERSSPKVYPYLKPDYLICTNLIRDSIRRNAHPEFIFNVINNSLPKETKLILNADDLITSALGKDNEKVYFGIDKMDTDFKECENIINDMPICPVCHTKLKYNYIKYNHIGNAYCPECGFKSKKADYLITKIDYENKLAVVNNRGNNEEYKLLNSTSIFNTYNMLAVVALLREFGFSDIKVKELLENLKIMKSRFETYNVEGIDIICNMTKGLNSIATSCVYDYVKKAPGKKDVILMLENPYDAMGWPENVTWLYDTDFEFLKDDSIERIIIGGLRAKDYYVRCLMAGIDKDKITCERYEVDTYKHLSLSKENYIYILFDLDALDNKLDKLQQNITNAIKEEYNK